MEVIKMKKVMVLLMVLGLVSAANATVIDIVITSLNGQSITPTSEITIAPSDKVDMQITFLAPNTEYVFGLGVFVNVTGPGTLDLSQIVRNPGFNPPGEIIGPNYIVEAGGMSPPRGNAPTPVVLISNILLHCDANGDVTVKLSDYPLSPTLILDIDYNQIPFVYGPGVIIHQVPACWLWPRQPEGDANNDGEINSLDLLALRKAWLTSFTGSPSGTGYGQYNPCADFNHDYIVNSKDLAKLRQNWLN
jgi:hypothetical protein